MFLRKSFNQSLLIGQNSSLLESLKKDSEKHDKNKDKYEKEDKAEKEDQEAYYSAAHHSFIRRIANQDGQLVIVILYIKALIGVKI